MGKKVDIINNINTKLADASSITAQEHREALAIDTNSVLEAVYGSPLIDDETTTNVVTKSGTDITYDIVTQKVGRRVTINGILTNISTSDWFTNKDVFDITLSEYLQDSNIYYSHGLGNNNYSYNIKLESNTLTIDTTIAPTISVKFSLTYNTIA